MHGTIPYPDNNAIGFPKTYSLDRDYLLYNVSTFLISGPGGLA